MRGSTDRIAHYNGIDPTRHSVHNTGMSQSNTAKPTPTPLNPAQIRQLRALAHHLRPVVMIGNKGLTEQVSNETDRALAHHELIKVRGAADGKPARRAELQKLADATGSQLVQLIGRIGVLYREAETPSITFSKVAKKP